jgi:hypothetical protein
MNKVLRDLLLVAAILVPLEVFLNSEWHQLVGRDLREYLADLARPSARTRVLIVGDSHPHNAFLLAKLPDSIANVSFGSESLRDVHLKLTTLLRRGIKPRTLVIPADDHIFSPYRELTNNEQSVVLGADVEDYNLVYGRSMSLLKKVAIDAYPLIDLQNRNFLVTLLIEKYLRRSGGGTADGKPAVGQTWATMPAEKRARIADDRLASQFGDRFELSSLMRGTWGQIMTLCRTNNIRVVAVRYPVTDEYRARLPRYDLSAVGNTLRELPPDTVLDYSAIYAGQAVYFADSDHLSTAGSSAFVPHFLADLQAVSGSRK